MNYWSFYFYFFSGCVNGDKLHLCIQEECGVTW